MSTMPTVTVAGGGISGLTAALRLAERGYQVKLYEPKAWLGGNLGSRQAGDGGYLDVYPHMYLEWYDNFWALLEEVTKQRREERFESFSTVRQLAKGAFPKFASLTDMYSPSHLLQNLFSAMGKPADMFVFGYANIDLLAETLNPTVNLDNIDVNAFLNSRPYMTKAASAAVDSFITQVWAIPSYLASAQDFREYLQYCLIKPTPAFWLPTGPAFTHVIDPLVTAVRQAGVEIFTRTAVTGISSTGTRVTQIRLADTEFDEDTASWAPVGGDGRTEPVDNLLLAVPPATLSKLVRSAAVPGEGTVVAAAPDLAGIVRLKEAQVPLVYLYFKRRVPRLPSEPVGLFGSELSLAFSDVSQMWRDVPAFRGRTVLAVSSSDPGGLPGTGNEADAYAMLRELSEYLPFDPGEHWGESPDIDWERTCYEANLDTQLFINQVGTDSWRPQPASDHIRNIYLAGDFCSNDVGMTTVESAVTTGLAAAKALVDRTGFGEPVEIIPPRTSMLRDAAYVWLRYALGPSAYAASLISRITGLATSDHPPSSAGAVPWFPVPRRAVPGLSWARRMAGRFADQRRDS